MSERLHVNTKREIEYGYSIHVDREILLGWLYDNDVPVYGSDTNEWEIERSYLEELPDSAYVDLHNTWGKGEDYIEIDADELRELVREMLESQADSDYVFISWF